jgi:hypothetical protein
MHPYIVGFVRMGKKRKSRSGEIGFEGVRGK